AKEARGLAREREDEPDQPRFAASEEPRDRRDLKRAPARIGAVLQRRLPPRSLLAHPDAGPVDRERRALWLGLPRHRRLHRLPTRGVQERPRPPRRGAERLRQLRPDRALSSSRLRRTEKKFRRRVDWQRAGDPYCIFVTKTQ